ncbi:hypothetical protein [Flindersiella endophytica]
MTTTLAPPLQRQRLPLRRTAWLPYAVLVWALAYGSLRLWWALGGQPDIPPMGYDLLGITGWPVVVLCALAAGLAPALARQPRSKPLGWTLTGLAGVVSAGLVAGAGLILLDVVGTLFGGLGMFHSLTGAASRAGCLAGGLLLARLAVTYQRTLRGGCLTCGRTDASPTPARTPRWAYAAAYAAVLAYLTRIGAQYAVGFGEQAAPIRGEGDLAATISEWAFLIGTALAGILLPLALVHRFGRIWPRWTLFLSGRKVPRWLVLGPAFALSAGLVAYFGTGMIQMIIDPFESTDALPGWFFWVAVPAYVAWGAGLGIAAFAYRAMTRPACGGCGAPDVREQPDPSRTSRRSAW